MNREQQILSIARRKIQQGIPPDEQYAALNAARDKRKQRRERNMRILLAGGVAQVPILKP